MSKTSSNENYQHSCEGKRGALADSRATLDKIFSPEELSQVVRFYLLEPLTARDGKQKNTGQRHLSLFKWSGNSLPTLERELLKSSGIPSFIMLGSSSIAQTLKNMDLDGETICTEHPRAVMQRPAKLTMKEDGAIDRRYSDSNRMVCLLRHIRNSIAHGLTYKFENGMILLQDQSSESTITARILLSKQSLLDWIDIVERNNQ